MTTAQLSMIAPPPSVAAVLGALTEETRIGQVDFTTRLAPDPEPAELLEGYDEVVTLAEDAEDDEDDLAPDTGTDDEPTAGVFALVSVPALARHEDDVEVGDHDDDEADEDVQDVQDDAAAAAPPAPEPAAPEPAAPEALETVVDETVPASFEERIHEPAPLQASQEPAPSVDPDERPPTVEEIARLVIERMHDAELAMMRHLDAIEVEAARRSELLTAQAELDAELIRLNARREAHGIVTAARVRAGGQPTVSAEERRLDELTESLSRFADVVDELRPAGTRSVPWGRTP